MPSLDLPTGDGTTSGWNDTRYFAIRHFRLASMSPGTSWYASMVIVVLEK